MPFRRDAERYAPRLANCSHEVGVRQRIRRGDIDDAVDEALLDQKADGANKILVVNPRHELPPVARLAAEAEAHEVEEDGERSAGIGRHDDSGAQLHLARARSLRLIDCALPIASDLEAEPPRGR